MSKTEKADLLWPDVNLSKAPPEAMLFEVELEMWRAQFERGTRVLEACVKAVAAEAGLNCPNEFIAQRAAGLAALVMHHSRRVDELFRSDDGRASNDGDLLFR